MVDSENYAGTDYDPQAQGTPPEARTPRGDAHGAATQYAEQGDRAKGTQDPYPYDPTNELLDGDDHPSRGDIAAKGLRITDSGRALRHEDDPSGYEIIPGPHTNLELDKSVEKHAVARDVSAGLDPEIGRKARAEAVAKAAEARKADRAGGGNAEERAAAAEQSRSEAPKGRTSTPTKSTTAKS